MLTLMVKLFMIWKKKNQGLRITGNWLILIIKLSMSLTKIYNFRVFVSSFSSGQSTQMTKQRLVSSKFEEDWLAPVARAVTCHTFERWKMRPLFVSLVDLFQNRKKKRRKGEKVDIWPARVTHIRLRFPPLLTSLPLHETFPASYSIVPFQNLFIIL